MHHLCGLCMHTFIHVGRSISFGRHVWLAIELPCYWLLCFMHASVPDMINVRVARSVPVSGTMVWTVWSRVFEQRARKRKSQYNGNSTCGSVGHVLPHIASMSHLTPVSHTCPCLCFLQAAAR